VNISVKVKPGAKENSVEDLGESGYVVRVKEKAIEGRANAAVVKALSEFFDVPKNRITVIKGFKSKNKVIEIF
jgi:uncharacterized protein